MSEYLTKMMNIMWTAPFQKDEEQQIIALNEYQKSLAQFDDGVQKEVYERIKCTHKKQNWPLISELVKVCNQVRAEKIAAKPQPRMMSDAELLLTDQGRYAWDAKCGRSFTIVCWQEKRLLSMDEAKKLVIRENRAKNEPFELPDTELGNYLRGVHKTMHEAETNFQNQFTRIMS